MQFHPARHASGARPPCRPAPACPLPPQLQRRQPTMPGTLEMIISPVVVDWVGVQ